jgi:hypothetical protein
MLRNLFRSRSRNEDVSGEIDDQDGNNGNKSYKAPAMSVPASRRRALAATAATGNKPVVTKTRQFEDEGRETVAGANWTPRVEADLRAIARELRCLRNKLLQHAKFNKWLYTTFNLLVFLLAAIMVIYPTRLLAILVAILTGIDQILDFQRIAEFQYETAFDLNQLIDTIRATLLLPVNERIDGIVFLREIQARRDQILRIFYQEEY